MIIEYLRNETHSRDTNREYIMKGNTYILKRIQTVKL